MSYGSFWDSAEGDEYRRIQMVVSTARGAVSAKPVGKRAKGAVRERDLIIAAASEWERAYRNGGWPRPKADVALDVMAVTNKNAPQPQNFAKRLLDQLGGTGNDSPIVYHDDRQVSMLFVRVDEFAPAEPEIYFAAQRASVVRDMIRRNDRVDLEKRAPNEVDSEWERLESQVEADEDAISDWRNDTTEVGKRFYDHALRAWRYHSQQHALASNDRHSRDLLHSYASLRSRDPLEFYELTASLLDMLGTMPYAFNFGQLPSKEGETGLFRERIRVELRARASLYPHLYPLQQPIGLTAFVVPNSVGKDADNVFRDLVVPTLLDELKPPRAAQYPTIDKPNSETSPGQPHIHFIETINLAGISRPPGTLVIALSHGYRHQSWWQLALDAAPS